jgi:hypothetical protein
MPIVRFEAGERVPARGSYALLKEWGEPAGVIVRLEKGEPLPSVPADTEPPVWYVRVEEPGEDPYADLLEAFRAHNDKLPDEPGVQARVMVRT